MTNTVNKIGMISILQIKADIKARANIKNR